MYHRDTFVNFLNSKIATKNIEIYIVHRPQAFRLSIYMRIEYLKSGIKD